MSEIKSVVLPECQEGFTDIRLAVGLMERDILSQTKITDKLTEAVQKIEEMNANLVKMIALHELKHENANDDIKELDRRLDELHERGLRTSTTTTTTTTEEESKKTLKQLERWKWMIIGGAFVVGWILAHLKWSLLVTLFGG